MQRLEVARRPAARRRSRRLPRTRTPRPTTRRRVRGADQEPVPGLSIRRRPGVEALSYRRPHALKRPPFAALPRRLPFFHVESIAGAQEVEASVRADYRFGAVHHHVALADDVEAIAFHDDGGVFVDTDAEQLRMLVDHLEHVELAVAAQQMLIDRR